MRRILFYYHHFGGLGHGMRIYSLCKAIKKLQPTYRLLVINSGIAQPELDIGCYAKIVNLPPFKATAGLFSGLYSQEDITITFKKRSKILRILSDSFIPDLAIFEHFPFGRDSLEKEIIGFIKYLKAKKIPIYSSVRDIIDQKLNEQNLYHRLKLFSGIFVHSDKEMGFSTKFKQREELKNKLIFTGRLIPIEKNELSNKTDIKKKLGCTNKKLIIISIGGGIDGTDILEKLIKVKEKLDLELKTLFLISTGPSIDDDIFRGMINKTKARSDIIIKKFIPDYINLINAADLYVSMGGYNSVNNILFTGVKNIIFPRQSDNEQKIRIRYFRKFLKSANIRLTDNNFAIKLVRVIQNNKHCKYSDDFQGAISSSRFLERILNLNYVKIRLTTKCKYACDMCSWKRKKEELDSVVIKKIITQAKLLNVKTIGFSGGEPLLHPYFYNLIKFVKEQGLLISVSTNGSTDKKSLRFLLKYTDYLDISLHSYDEEINDKIMGKKGAFRDTLCFIKHIWIENRNIMIHVNVTVRPDNFNGIHKIVNILKKHINSISFTLADRTINDLKYLKFSKKELQLFYLHEIPLILKDGLSNNIQIRISPFFKEFDNIDDRNKLEKLLKNREYYTDILRSIFIPLPLYQCPKAREGLRINSNGEISPCCFLDDYPVNLGNIHNSSLLDIVSSDKYYNFINSAMPNRGWCKQCAKGYSAYAKILKLK